MKTFVNNILGRKPATTPVRVPVREGPDYRALEDVVFTESKKNFLQVPRGDAASSAAANANVMKAMDDWPTETPNPKRKGSLSDREIDDLYVKVNNDNYEMCSVKKYDPDGNAERAQQVIQETIAAAFRELDLRRHLAKSHGAETACPMTTGIFAWIAAHAAAEEEAAGRLRVTPWWRILKDGDKLNPKYPGGAEEQARRLRAEGHRVERGRVIRDEGGKLKSWPSNPS